MLFEVQATTTMHDVSFSPSNEIGLTGHFGRLIAMARIVFGFGFSGVGSWFCV
jgi:hypothetical protein